MEIERITLYHFPATRSARVKWLLHELLDEAFDTEPVQLYDAEQYGPDFRSINPNHAVPTLRIRTVDGEEITMIESGAMITLLADLHPKKGFSPPPLPFSAARADYLQMIHFCGASIDMMLWQLRVHTHILPPSKQDGATRSRYWAKFHDEVEPQLRLRLEAVPYVCGDGFSAADCMIAHAVMWAKSYGLCRDPVFKAYLSRMSKRQAFVQAFADAHNFDPQVPERARVQAHFSG